MSQPLKSFEGPDVKALLARIRREVGPDAEISGAEKIRIGGLLGFFAKEQYRVLVRVPEVSGVLRPLESERRRQSAHARPRRRAGRRGDKASGPSASPVIFRDEVTAPVGIVAPQPDVFAVLAEATDDVNDVGGFAPVLGATSVLAAAGDHRLGGDSYGAGVQRATPGGATDDESFETVLSRIATTLDSPLPALTAPAVNADTAGQTARELAGVSDGAGIVAEGSAPPAQANFIGAARAAPSPLPEAMGAPDPGTIHVRDLLGTSLASEAARFLAGPAGAPLHDAVESLRRAGMDGALLGWASEALAVGRDVQGSLLDVFGRIPVPPAVPRRPGSLLVVAGAGLRSRGLAEALAFEIGADPADVAFATLAPDTEEPAGRRLVIRTAEEAGELAPGWRRSGVAMVAVDVALTAGHRSWAAHLIAALRPTSVWGVVEATCKSEDVRAWAEDLGGVDGLAIENLDSTVSPVAVLEAGIPVARLDGRPASAARWTATVVDRMGQCT
ncbi:MAG TPA: hypothetical protein VED63_01105 [Acidimicrobiales bacterium]|nr:hypothetical protein [Acidimicrobiales bacterium]